MAEVAAQSVREWQAFLAAYQQHAVGAQAAAQEAAEGEAAGEPVVASPVVADGYFGPVTQEVTRAFQAQVGLPPTGEVDAATRIRAAEWMRGVGITPPEPVEIDEPGFCRHFGIGPDRPDILECRPYYLLPMQGLASPEYAGYLESQIASNAGARKVTDLFVLSHGWHRNFYSAVAAYDRTIARFAILFRRGRLAEVLPPDFNPMFLALHWHSDPDDSEFVDLGGRRSRLDFMRRVHDLFEPAAGRNFTVDFEDIFAYISTVSAPNIHALGADKLAEGKRLLGLLEHHALRDAPDATVQERSAAAWLAHAESAPAGAFEDRAGRTPRFLSFEQALGTTLRFLLAALGVAGLAGLVGPWLQQQVPGNHELYRLILGNWLFWLTVSAFLFTLLASIREIRPNGRFGLAGWVGLVAWVPVQIACAIPLVVASFTTFLLGGLFAGLRPRSPGMPGLYEERNGKRNHAPPSRPTRPPLVRSALAWLARMPALALQVISDPLSIPRSVGVAVDRQLSFYEMQHRAVKTGSEAAELLARLAALPGMGGVRIHLVGHSFGALALANTVRELALRPDHRGAMEQERCTVESVTLLQGALAANWFEGEPRTLESIKGCLAAIHSARDTATGFYYPLGQNARAAAGAVGLFLGKDGEVQDRRRMPALVKPPQLDEPDLRDRDRNGVPVPAQPPLPGRPYCYNLDAGRIITDGPAIAGGGHDDVFKDDVVNLVLAAITRRLRPDGGISEKAPGGAAEE